MGVSTFLIQFKLNEEFNVKFHIFIYDNLILST